MKIAVIGSGAMGSSIAAHIANCNHKVILLDLASEKIDEPNLLLHAALEKIQAKPYALSHPKRLELITIGNLQNDLNLLSQCDLVIEAVVEKLEIKHALFAKIAPYLKPECVIASNTSTLLLKDLKAQNIWQQTIILHFFNPPKHLPLVEFVADSQTSEHKIAQIKSFLYHQLGRQIVDCQDSPGFIANRIGCFLMKFALHKAIEDNLEIVKIDQLANKLLQLPKTGFFGLYDLIGLDVMSMIDASLSSKLQADDAYNKLNEANYVIEKLTRSGKLGLKTGAGFYTKQAGQKLALNLKTLEYEPITTDEKTPQTYKNYFNHLAEAAKFYSARLIPNVAKNIEDVNKAMALGFNWSIPPSQFSMALENKAQPLKQQAQSLGEKILENQAAEIFAYKQAIVFSPKTKLNIFTFKVFELLNQAITIAQEQKTRLIIYPRGGCFSAGGDLRLFLDCALRQDLKTAQEFLILGQQTFRRIKYSTVPVIAIAENIALGGGCELLLHCHLVIADINLQAGLVESSIGLVPSWGGINQILCLAQNQQAGQITRALTNIICAYKTRSADYFAEKYFANTHIIPQMADRLDYATSLDINSWQANLENDNPIKLGPIKAEELNLENLDEYGKFIASKILQLLQKQELSQKEILQGEQAIFLELLTKPETIEKIANILPR